MADKVKQVSYAYVRVADKAGEGAKVLQALQKARVNLVAYAGFPAGRGKAQLVFVPESMDDLVSAARANGLRLSRTKRALLVSGRDRVGAVSDLLKRLARARISVTAAHAISAPPRRYGMVVWVKPRDYRKAARALRAR